MFRLSKQTLITNKMVFPRFFFENLYVRFWPGPQIVTINIVRASHWDQVNNLNNLLNRIELYKFDEQKSEFEKLG